MTRHTKTARPSSSPAGGHSDGGLSSSLPPVAQADDTGRMYLLDDYYGMDEESDAARNTRPDAQARAFVWAAFGAALLGLIVAACFSVWRMW